ncbi:MAG: hypothetical protein IRZ15_05700 [Bryobacteraceae bacterium]|nr:hypothetical protein [Bryobacteraceae bacterium]
MKVVVVGECESANIYESWDPDEPDEIEVEGYAAKALSCIYPDYLCCVFDGGFLFEGEIYRPDLALVAKDLSHWFIIEVELLSHSLHGHVLPQVTAFHRGEPQPDCVLKLARALGIEKSVAQTLVTYVPRSVAVVANKPDFNWEMILRSHRIQFLSLSVYRSRHHVHAIELAGRLEVVQESLGFGTYIATDRSIRLPANVRLPDGPIQFVEQGGGVGTWYLRRFGSAAWLTKQAGVPSIPDRSYVQIIRTAAGTLSLRRP